MRPSTATPGVPAGSGILTRYYPRRQVLVVLGDRPDLNPIPLNDPILAQYPQLLERARETERREAELVRPEQP